MKETPILFSTAMVQAIIAGQKTQTRRTRGLEIINQNPDNYLFYVMGGNKKEVCFKIISMEKYTYIKCPFGQVGDLLWVRESFTHIFDVKTPRNGWVVYKADDSCKKITKWKPSIHMPKAAARIWLKIIDIRVERLHNISEEDAINEGVKIGESIQKQVNLYYNYESELFNFQQAKASFKSLWISINGNDSWIKNPWVWVIEFKLSNKAGK